MARIILRQDGWFGEDKARRGIMERISALNQSDLSASALREALRQLPKNESFCSYFLEDDDLFASYRKGERLPIDVYLGTIRE